MGKSLLSSTSSTNIFGSWYKAVILTCISIFSFFLAIPLAYAVNADSPTSDVYLSKAPLVYLGNDGIEIRTSKLDNLRWIKPEERLLAVLNKTNKSSLSRLDSNNDGILDVLPNVSGATTIDIKTLTLTQGATGVTLEYPEPNGIFMQHPSPGTSNLYSVESFDLPLHLEYTIPTGVIAGAMSMGFLPVGSTLKPNTLADGAVKHNLSPNGNFCLFPVGLGSKTAGGFTKDQLFSIDIDASGTVTYKKNGVVVHTEPGLPTTKYFFAIGIGNSKGGRTWENVVFTTGGSSGGGGGTPPPPAPDADGDGVSDAKELTD